MKQAIKESNFENVTNIIKEVKRIFILEVLKQYLIKIFKKEKNLRQKPPKTIPQKLQMTVKI